MTERVLSVGTVFQPWTPLTHWQGTCVPITLGESTAQFAWGADTTVGQFLRWDDFFQRCAPKDAHDAKAVRRRHEQPLVSPFVELAAISERLRLAAGASGKRTEIDSYLGNLEAIQMAYADAAEMQRSYEGYDNTQQAAFYAHKKARLLAEANDILATAKALLRYGSDR